MVMDFISVGRRVAEKPAWSSQAAARLHWPVQMVPVHGRMELDDLLGQKVLENGSTPYQYGALSIAVKEGHILILDEMDVADSE